MYAYEPDYRIPVSSRGSRIIRFGYFRRSVADAHLRSGSVACPREERDYRRRPQTDAAYDVLYYYGTGRGQPRNGRFGICTRRLSCARRARKTSRLALPFQAREPDCVLEYYVLFEQALHLSFARRARQQGKLKTVRGRRIRQRRYEMQ